MLFLSVSYLLLLFLFYYFTLAWCRPTILPTEPYLDLDLDHMMIFLSLVYALLKERAVQHGNRILKVRSYKNFNAEKFKEDLIMADWEVVEIFESVDDQYEY